jgi:hypothetical protein
MIDKGHTPTDSETSDMHNNGVLCACVRGYASYKQASDILIDYTEPY